jgi:hypothetical protein
VLDEDDEPVKDVIAVGLQNVIEGNRNPLSDYNEAFRNVQARQRMKPVIPGSAKGETPATEDINSVTSLDIAKHLPRRQERDSQLELATVTSMYNASHDIGTDSEAEEGAVYDGMSIL